MYALKRLKQAHTLFGEKNDSQELYMGPGVISVRAGRGALKGIG
jgi:hypothetical protein